jgi:uncharacterized protein YndB with AHSA1/START domain
VEIIQEHVINAPREKVFKSLTQEVNSWWVHAIQEDSELYLEPKIGGHFGENFKGGGGMRFATVTWLKPGVEIELNGPMAFDGPVTGCFSFTLEDKGKGTLVKLEHKMFGPISDETKGMYTEGWNEMLGTGLKQYVETGKRVR